MDGTLEVYLESALIVLLPVTIGFWLRHSLQWWFETPTQDEARTRNAVETIDAEKEAWR